MEEKRLQKEQLDELLKQYYEIIESLESYRKGFKSKKYREFTNEQKRQAKMQFLFLKSCENDTIRVLIDHGHVDEEILSNAMANRYLPIRTRWQCLKLLTKKITRRKI